jgi:hypothetical protein
MRHVRVLGLLLIGLSACDRGDILEIIGEVRSGDGAAVPGSERIPFEVFSDEVGDRNLTERRVLLKTRDAYQTFFGHAPPASVNFDREWVIFYAAGQRPSTGFVASLRSLARAGTRLHAVTQLQSPGRTCVVGDAITVPNVLVKFRAQPDTSSVDFSRVDITVDCSLTDPCATIDCAAGTHCVARPVTCVRAPCPPVAVCVPDGPFCGGIAGIRCPGGGTCQDNPGDSCDPRTGGADCGGICKCNVIADCSAPTVWDGSPEVCACVPAKDPGAGNQCGSKTCGSGEYCCNPSCGICAPKGGACIQIHCG